MTGRNYIFHDIFEYFYILYIFKLSNFNYFLSELPLTKYTLLRIRTSISNCKLFFSDVQLWLKTLRLHKYSYLFATMSYEDMLQLTEDQLAEQGVTKGARHKLALSIAKLQQRYNTLLNLEKGLVQPSARDGMQNTSFSQGPSLLINTMEELKTILATPMKPSQESDPQDIPAQFTKVLGKCMYEPSFNCIIKISLEKDIVIV